MRVGEFEILADGRISGPAAYLSSAHYAEARRKIEDGTHCLIATAPPMPIDALIGVILQTSYAEWRGAHLFTMRDENPIQRLA